MRFFLRRLLGGVFTTYIDLSEGGGGGFLGRNTRSDDSVECDFCLRITGAVSGSGEGTSFKEKLSESEEFSKKEDVSKECCIRSISLFKMLR